MRIQRRLALLLLVLSTGLYLLSMQRAIYGDGIFFEPKLREADLAYPHILYLPLVWTIWSGLSSLFPIDAETGLKMVSAMAGGAGVALTYLIAARAMHSFLRALTAALMLMGFWGLGLFTTLKPPRTDTPGMVRVIQVQHDGQWYRSGNGVAKVFGHHRHCLVFTIWLSPL